MKLESIKNYHMILFVLFLFTYLLPQLGWGWGIRIREWIKISVRGLFFSSLVILILEHYVVLEQWIGFIAVFLTYIIVNFLYIKKDPKKGMNFLIGIITFLFLSFVFYRHSEVWHLIQKGWKFQNSSTLIRDNSWLKFLALLAGYYITIFPAGVYIGGICNEVYQSAEFDKSGFKDAGKWIGRLERTIILTLFLANKVELIAWVLGLKGLLRFGEIQASQVKVKIDGNGHIEIPKSQVESTLRKEVEYILIGTLLSFVAAMAVGFLLSLGAGVKLGS
jgi:hypothetical protein